MEISIDKINQRQDPYQLFLDSIKAPDTTRKYKKDLYKFLSAIPEKIYQDTLGKMPQDTESQTLASFFVELARKDPDLAYNIIATFIKLKTIKEKHSDVMDCVNKAHHLGKLFAGAGNITTIFNMWGVCP